MYNSDEDDLFHELLNDNRSDETNSTVVKSSETTNTDDELFYDECIPQFEDADETFPEENIVKLDKMYIAVLDELSRRILNAIHQTKEKRVSIDRREKELNDIKDKPLPRKNWYHLFGSPYFKDKSFFPCPGNEDFYKKLSKNEINYHELPPVRRWKSNEQTKLEEAVRNNVIEIKRKEFKTARDNIIKKLKINSLTSEEREEINMELENLDERDLHIESCTTENLLKRNTKELDWLRISVVDFDGQRGSEELQAMWELCLHPSICRNKWTQEENEKLAEIVKKHNMEDWDKIALELNTNRSGFQCFVQYQRNLNKNLRKSKWTEEEDNNLRKIIEECRIGDYIPWSKVALRMKGRTKVQVYNRWTYSIDPVIRKGRFTPEEDCLIVAGVQRYGKNFPRISRFLPGRTSIQIRDRFIGSLQKVGPIGRWTRDEDKLLMELVDRYGTKSWSKIASKFSGRFRTQVRHRYMTIKKWMAKYPDLPLEYAPSRYVGDNCNHQSNIWSQVQSILKSSLKKRIMQEEGFREENLLLLKKKLNMVNPKRCGRKAGSRKPLTTAEMKLMEHTLSNCILRSGRRKYNFDEECHQRRQYIAGLLLHVFNVRLAFPFPDKVIEDDDSLDSADKFVLISLKKIYNEKMKKDIDACGAATTSAKRIRLNGSISTSKTMASNNVMSRYNGEWLPLYFPDEIPSIQIVGNIPPSLCTLIGYRTAYAAKTRLKEYERTLDEKMIALPCWRPPNLGPGEKKVKRFSKEDCEKLFNERLQILFGWTALLKDTKPQIHENVFTKNMEHANKNPPQNYEFNSSDKTSDHFINKSDPFRSILRDKKKNESKEKLKASTDEESKLNVENTRGASQRKRLKSNKEYKTLKVKEPTKMPSRRSARLSKLQE